MTKRNLLDSNTPQIVKIDNIEVCTEEAAMTFEGMTCAERSKYQGMTDIAIIKSIYITHFGYFKQ